MVDESVVKIPIKEGVVDISSFLDAKRQAVMIASDEDEVRRLFGIEEEKRQFSDALVAAARARNDDSITPEVALAATEKVYDGFFEFQELPGGPATKLKGLYINRVNHVYKPSLVIGAVAAAILGIVSGVGYIQERVHEANLIEQEQTVENSIEKLSRKKSTLENQIAEIYNYVSEKRPPEAGDLNDILALAKGQLKKTDDFFVRYTPPEQQVTRENFTGASKEADLVKDILEQASQQLSRGKEIITFNDDLVEVRQSLDSLIGEVRSAKPVNVLMDRADVAYNSGIAAVEHRQLAQAKDYKSQLAGIKRSVHQFAAMPAELDKAYHAVMSVVEHSPTRHWAEKMYAEGTAYVQNVDVPNLEQTIRDLSDKAAILNQEYEIFIVRQPDVRTVWDIEWFETKGGRKRVTRVDFFARCKAKKDGRVVPITFYDVALDRTVTASTFGYRISGDELRGVSDDDMMEEFRNFVGSGAYQKTPLAVKERGYPDEEARYRSSYARTVLPFTDKTSLIPNN